MAQFNVNLAFNADTGRAKTQIQELQSLLSKIAYTGTTTNMAGGIEKDLHAASEAAKELQFHLNNAFNTSTGNFDLSMLDRSLKTSGSNIADLSAKILSIGPDGQQAFLKLAQSISLADQPMLRISKRMQDFAVTMKNTIKWQLSSSMLHGFMGAIQSAYGYAQDLNKSLNDIRIVTGYNIDQMSEFADQANRAAKNLNTTTTDYTKASLIYFQQGLNDAEVQARTDITIKMANVVGQSADIVSEQLTAIWNNFDDGSQSLEYYADVMTALGAATASSSDEIAEGLSKFSAVAGTVGLSYEYATAALATLTSNTRESADVVGNSLKTLFARIQGLQLGETLDDGTDLNKYSQALEKVGISIYDANGGLKDMDNILNEMAARWDTLSDTQQVALAQTVAGVRQYNQLIALMDNWNNGDGDSMMANLKTIQGAEGTLDEQAEIYAQSWEAAQKRVQAAAEGIYQSLLDDKFFISLNHGFANVLGGLESFIDGIGGFKGVILGLGSIITTMFAHKIPQALDTVKYNLEFITKGSESAYKRIQQGMQESTNRAFGLNKEGTEQISQPIIQKDSATGYAIQQANELTAARSKLAVVSGKMSESEKQMAEMELGFIKTAQDEVIALKQKNEALEKSIQLQKQNIKNSSINKDAQTQSTKSESDMANLNKIVQQKYREAQDSFNESRSQPTPPDNLGALDDQVQQLDFLATEMKGFAALYQEAITEINESYSQIGSNILDKFMAEGDLSAKEEIIKFPEYFQAAFAEIKSTTTEFSGFLQDEFNFDTVQKQVAALGNTIPKAIQEATGLDKIFRNLQNAVDGDEFIAEFAILEEKLKECKIEGKDFKKVLEGLYGANKVDKLTVDMEELGLNIDEATKKAELLKKRLEQFSPQHITRTAEAFVSLGSLAGNVVTVINSVKTAFDSLTNPDLSGWEKFTAVLSAVSMVIPSVMSGMSNYATLVGWLNTQLTAQATAQVAATLATEGNVIATALSAQGITAETLITEQNNAAKLQNVLVEKLGMTTTAASNVITTACNALKAKGMALTWGNIAAEIVRNGVMDVTNKKLSAQAVLLTIVKALMGDFASIVKVAAAALAIFAAVKVFQWIDDAIVTQKEANEAINESTEAYNKQKEAVEGLESELKTIQDRIKELQDGGPLSLVEQEELDRLLSQEASLERQLAIEKELLEIEKQKHLDNFTENHKAASRWVNDIPDDAPTFTVQKPVENNSNAGKSAGTGAMTDVAGMDTQTGDTATPVASGSVATGAMSNIPGMVKTTPTDTNNTPSPSVAPSKGTVEVEPEREGATTQQENSTKDVEMSQTDYYNEYIKDIEQKKPEERSSEEKKLLDEYYDAIEQQREDQIQWYKDNLEDINNYREGYEAWLEANPDASDDVKKEMVAPIVAADKALYGDQYEEKVYGADSVTAMMHQSEVYSGIDYQDLMMDDFLADGTMNMTGEELANQFTAGFRAQLYEQGIVPEDYATWLISEGEKLISGVQNNLKISDGVTLEGLQNDERWQEGDLEILAKVKIEEGDDMDAIFKKIEETRFEINAPAINQQYEKLAEGYDIDVEEFKAYRDLLAESNAELAKSPALLNKAALAHKRYEKGMDSLIENFEEWDKVMKSDNIMEISKILPEVNTAVKDILDLDDDAFSKLSPDFAVENWDLITEAMNGSEEAYVKLSERAATEIILGAKFDADGLNASEQEILTAIDNLRAEDVEIGTHFNTSQAAQDLFNLMMEQGATVEQMQAAFDQLGWNPDLNYEEMTIDEAAANGSYTNKQVWVPNSDGMGWHQVTLTDAAQMGMDGSTIVRVPIIGSEFKKIGSGGGGNYTPPKKPGGGGGGGSKKHAEIKDTGDRTRYHTLQNQLEDLQSEYDNISEAADRAFGKDKLKLMDEQGKALDDLISKQEEYVKVLSEDVPVDQDVMDTYYNDLIDNGPAIEYDERGNIANYDDIEAAMHAKYNDMATKYTDDSVEWQAFEKQYEQLEKYIEDYEKYYDELRDAETEYQDLINQRIDLNLAKVQYRIEIELAVPEDSIAFIEYQLGKIEDDAFESAKAIKLLTSQAESVYDQIQINKQGLNDILALSLDAEDITKVMAGNLSVLENATFTAEQIDAIKEYRDSLMALNEQFDEIRESIEEKVIATFEAYQEEVDRGIATLEHYTSVLESYQNIVDIVGKDTLGISAEFMNGLAQANVDSAINSLAAAKSSYEAVTAAQKEASEAWAKAKENDDAASMKMWEETLITLNESAEAASEELMAAWEEALSGIVAAFDVALEQAVEDFNDAIYSMGGLDGLLGAFEQAQTTSDLMLDDYQQIYELSKLSRDINNSIDDTDNLAGKQKLKKLLEDINKLQADGVEMSQYDLEYLQAEYDLRLAEIELEEARNAKNTVRLQQDNEGNWSYVYTQNTDAVDEAQQKYEDALYSMQDLSSNYIDEMSEQLIDTSQEMAEALAALRVEDFASYDDYYKEVLRIQSEYEDRMAIQEGELQKAIDNNKILYEQDWTNYHNATGYKISDTEKFATSFKDTLLGTLMDSESDSANFADLISGATDTLAQNLAIAAKEYYLNIEQAMQTAGTSTSQFAEDAEKNIAAIIQASADGALSVEETTKKMTEDLQKVTDQVKNWQETYGLAMQAIQEENEKVIQSFNDMIKALSLDADNITVQYDIVQKIIADETEEQATDEETPVSAATGGYTGSWGNSGKLAILHEKELILNKDDTSNFLSAIEITRSMLETIDLNAKQASLGMGNLTASTVKEETVQTLEQEVHITAEFPGVSDHNEVELALKSLVNTASQYANRK